MEESWILISQSLTPWTWSGRSAMPTTTDLSQPESCMWALRPDTVLGKGMSSFRSQMACFSTIGAMVSGQTWVWTSTCKATPSARGTL